MKYLVPVTAIVISTLCARAQQTALYLDSAGSFRSGLELFNKQQYSAAQKEFNRYMARPTSALGKSDAMYYAAACGIELFNKDAEWLMRDYIRRYPTGLQVNNAWFYLGKSGYRKKKYDETLKAFEHVDLYALDKEQLAELYFKRGYSYLQTGEEQKASHDFYEIKDIDNKYAAAATYYAAHIAYNQQQYEAALDGFRRLLNDETFGSAAPYYITQIFFIQGKYEDVVREAPKLLNDSAHIQKKDEINRMIGESYFSMKDFAKALSYLRNSGTANAKDSYALGYSYYKTGDWKNAVTYLQGATSANDSLAQSAWYHMGDAFTKLNEKSRARSAFYNAWQLKFDPAVSEDALFNFAKLSYELDFNPYNEAVKGFTQYLTEYPDSPRRDEVHKFLTNVYFSTRNYAQAIASLETMSSLDPALKLTYQRLIYFRGVEFFNNGDLENAAKQFRKSLAQNSDPRLNALDLYWLGETQYQRHDYSSAIDTWKRFQVTEGAPGLSEYDLSNYALGYAYFQRKEKDDYANANIAFRKFLMSGGHYDDNKIADATIRAADCYFMNRDFPQAADYYRKAIALGKQDIDYALYQKALCDGLNRNYNEKIDELKKIESRYPHSPYLVASLNEMAETYLNNLKDQENAILYYQKLLTDHGNSSFANNANAQLGNIYYARKQDDKALYYYDQFVKKDSHSEAAHEVLEAVKKIFEAKGDIEGMEKYFAAIGNPLSENQVEKALYTTAYEAYYNQKDCDAAMPKWESYISKFPEGRYIAEARFDLAECQYNKSQLDKALENYLFITTRPRSVYSEVALSKAAYIYFKDKKCAEALPLYRQLEEIAETPSNKTAAMLGTMRCAFSTNDYGTALEAANRVLGAEKMSPQQLSEAHYIRARSLYETNRLEDAFNEFKSITKTAKNVKGAEAWYYMAKIQFGKGEYKEVEKTVNKLISYEYSSDEWNNRGMLLLADAYVAGGQDADAEVILRTLLDSKPAEEFAKEAEARLEAIQKKKEPAVQQQPQELKLSPNQTKRDSVLYNNINDEGGKK